MARRDRVIGIGAAGRASIGLARDLSDFRLQRIDLILLLANPFQKLVCGRWIGRVRNQRAMAKAIAAIALSIETKFLGEMIVMVA